MAFVDEITISASAGRGGDGVVRFLHEKGKEFSGPAGGNGGNGGDVIFRGVRDLNKLSRYKGVSVFKAERGEDGHSKNMFGKAGKPVIIDVPVGSVITRMRQGGSFEIVNEGDEVVALKGGWGGKGNSEFKSSTNQYPEQFTEGREGEKEKFKIELKIIADVGLVGLPNAGKSSLLNALTNAGAKVGDYAFTTLDPNLGAFYGHVIADIPGLIEGASDGKGLGDTFLRHISRTKVLLHCVSAELEKPLEAFETIHEELKSYDPKLLEKKEVVVITKTDMTDEATLKKLRTAFKKKKVDVLEVTVLDDESVKKVSDALSAMLEKIDR